MITRSGTRCAAAAKVPPADLLAAAVVAAEKGAAVVLEAANRPKRIERKEGNDVVTETGTCELCGPCLSCCAPAWTRKCCRRLCADKAAERAIVDSLTAAFPGHAILGEEGGVLGDITSEYLWSVDPLVRARCTPLIQLHVRGGVGHRGAQTSLCCNGGAQDGTCSFSTGYSHFCVSVGVLRRAR